MELSASRWAEPAKIDAPSQTTLDSIRKTPPMAQHTPCKAQNAQLETPTTGSTSKLLKPGDPGFVNPYVTYVADLDPSGTMDDGRFYVGRQNHYVDQSPSRITRGSTNRNQNFRPPRRQAPQPTSNTKPALPSPTPSWASTSGRRQAPQTNGKSRSGIPAVVGQSCWAGRPVGTSCMVVYGFFGTAKATTGTTAPPTTAPISSLNTRRGNRGDDWGGNRGEEGWGETRGKDGKVESHQRSQVTWKPRDEPIPTAESAQAFFGTPKDIPARAPTPESRSSWTNNSNEIPQTLRDAPQVNRAESDRNGHGSVDQAKDHRGTSGWFTNPAFDRKGQPAQRPRPQSQAPPSSGGVHSGEREVVKGQECPLDQQPARPPEPPRCSEAASMPRDTVSAPPRPASQEGDPVVIQYPVGDGCWVKMVVYIERDSKTAYSRLSGLGQRQMSGVKVKTPEQLGDMVRDIVLDEKKNLLG
ncbi:hypothetical protein BG000_000123 [Podila horticola]|nr:hypothetical protein BG000_000123 [Podila horticola]